MMPQLQIEPGPCRATARPGAWTASWALHNESVERLLVGQVWLPYDLFHSPRYVPDPPLALASGGRILLEREVFCPTGPGTQIENAFLILLLGSGDERWRAFARLTIRVDAAGVPAQSCEAVTFQALAASTA